MSYTWSEIHEHLQRATSTPKARRSFSSIRATRPGLVEYLSIGRMLAALHVKDGCKERKNRSIRDLIRAAQSHDQWADEALVLTILALWPGLEAIFNRSRARRMGVHEDLVANILARAVEAVRTLDLGRVERVASTVLRNIERDLIRERRADCHRDILSVEIDADALSQDCEDTLLRVLTSDLRKLAGRDAELIFDVAFGGFTQVEAADRCGISPSAGRKRYQRAIATLRRQVEVAA